MQVLVWETTDSGNWIRIYTYFEVTVVKTGWKKLYDEDKVRKDGYVEQV